jgi:hypothetical protein
LVYLLLQAREDRRQLQQKHFAVPFARAAARALLSLAQTLSYLKSYQPGVHNPSIEEVLTYDQCHHIQGLCEYRQMGVECMLAHAGGPANCRMRCLSSASPDHQCPQTDFQGYFSNRYLQFENIRTAALKNEFTLDQVG